jgi:CubicO group peptidase (beta-lactamase class C family)
VRIIVEQAAARPIGWLMALAGCCALALPFRITHASGLPDDMGSYVGRAQAQFNVPGIAIAVVKDGKVVLEQGFGRRDIRDTQRVDAHTLFCIASNTKSFTATAIEILAEEGKLRLDDRVVDHLPWFRMSDPYVTREMRIRDLLAHRSGLGSHAGDLLLVPQTTYSAREVVERLRELPMATGFRDSFAYENVMFAVATLIIEQASGLSYAQFVTEHIFQPVGMSESRIDSTFLKPDDKVATAHMPQDDDTLMTVPPLAWANGRGAGGIYSNAHDMAKWLQALLAEGGKHRLLRPDNQKRMWSMITPIDIEAAIVPQLAAAQPAFFGYGEGWYLSDYRGQRLVWHTGGFPGAVSRVTMVPAMHLGIVVLTNQQSEAAFEAITLHILDRYMGSRGTDWIGAYTASDRITAALNSESDARRAHDLTPEAMAAHILTTYAGVYRDRWYGDVEVELQQGALRLRFTRTPRLIGSMIPQRDDTFLVRWDDRTLNADALIDFSVASDGNVREAHMSRASSHTASAYDFQDLDLLPIGSAQASGQ